MSSVNFQNPEYFYLLILLVPMVVWYIWKRKRMTVNMQVSSTAVFQDVPKSFRYYLLHLPFVLRMIVLALVIVLLARPQSTDNWSSKDVEGIDIVMALDISGSMLAEDLKPNRLEAAKNVAIEFVNSRQNDNIGLVLFSGESFTQSPLTTDKMALCNLFSAVSCEMIDVPGTAVGMGLATAINRIKESKAKSKVIILLTDGTNNVGEIDPIMAAELANSVKNDAGEDVKIRVYTIGVGTKGMAPFPFQTVFGVQRQMVPVDIDEPTLKKIAEITGGKYFRATDNESLQNIYKEIDKLEKTKVSVQEYSKKREEFMPFAVAAAVLLLLELLIRHLVLRHNP